ncbi:MAG: LLM class flavin-dependent oxidoreductase [Alphaproteobacteria bacterium]|nr:LLM class flavin-dependent oxidoreductase [Alphaproteobacteria bacterium]
MKLGLFMMPMHPVGRDLTEALDEDMRTVVHADRVGFDEVWVGQHYACSSEPISSPLIFMAGAIAQTKRIMFGTGVMNLPQNHPAQVACDVALFDHMSRGRLLFGIGPGGLISDFELFKVEDGPERVAMMQESIATILNIWRSDPPYRIPGRFWDISVVNSVIPELGIGPMAKPFQQPHPPIVMSAMSPSSSSARTAAEHGWGLLSAPFIPRRTLANHWAAYRESAAAAGRPAQGADWRVGRSIYVAPTDAEARDHVFDPAHGVYYYYKYLLNLMKRAQMTQIMSGDAAVPADSMTVESVLTDLVIHGSPASVAEQLVALRDEVGPFETIVLAQHDWCGTDRELRSMRLMAEQVIPKLQRAG